MSNAYNISTPAYIKLILHAHKYPFAAVDGVLLGRVKESEVHIVDAIPLFHSMTLAPMFEVAMLQVLHVVS
jgi:ER membrane protein complex subunit 8/9